MPVRWAIIGCGDVARKRVASAIRSDPDSELVAVCRRNEAELQRFQDDFRVPQALTNADDVIAATDIDAVYIATPVSFHCPQTIAAAETGKHVLVEKPMAMSVPECDRMIDSCQANDVRLSVAYYRRFYPVVERMQQLIKDGTVGRVMSVSAVTSTPFSMTPDDDGYWRVVPELGGGGALMDIGSHRLDLFLSMFGPVTEVCGITGTIAGDYAADDAACATLRFESGVIGNLQCYFGTSVDPDEFVILGTEARLVSRPLNDGSLEVQRAGETTAESHPPDSNFNAPLVRDFVEAIQSGSSPRVTGADGCAVNSVMAQVYCPSET